MEDFLQQIEKALEYNLYYLALQSTLTLPDICSALMSNNGENNKQKYINWFNSYFLEKDSLSAEECYNFRCSNLHQGKTANKKSNYSRILFLEPQNSNIIIHNCILNDAFCIDLNRFCNTMIKSVRAWYSKIKNDTTFQNNYTTFIKKYPTGLKPYIDGVPVIS